MKMHLNLIAAMVLAGFTMFTANAQTSVHTDGLTAITADQSEPQAAASGLVLEAGGTRRVIARFAMDGAHNLRVQLSNLQEYQTTIALVTPDGSIRWEQQVANQRAFAKMLDLKALLIEPGTYTLRVQAGEANLAQELIVKSRSVTLGAARHSAVVPGAPAMAGK